MDGVHPPRPCGVWNGGGVYCCWSASFSACGPRPVHTGAVLTSTAVVSCAVRCRVCGAVRVSAPLRCSRGGVSSVYSPLVVMVGGGIVDGWVACVVVGGIVSEGRQCYWHPRLRVGVPVCLHGGPVEWRGAVCCYVVPVFVLSPFSSRCSPVLCCPVPFVLSCFLFMLCAAVFVVGGEVRWCVLSIHCTCVVRASVRGVHCLSVIVLW